ncbi:MAG: Fur family transcriptional regulator [Myxococcota bacterium]
MDEVDEALEAFHKRLREEGLKSTRQRDVIVRTFFELDKHISVDELLVETRKKLPRVGYATVYRTLDLLVKQQFANPRHFDDGRTRYDPQFSKEQHDHLICVDCRRILEFDNSHLVDMIRGQALSMGFDVSRRRLEIYGSCRDPACEHRPDEKG